MASVNNLTVIYSHILFLVFSTGELEEKEKQIQELQLQIEKLTTDLANAAEKFNRDVNQVVVREEAMRRELQNNLDAKTEDFENLREQFTALKEDNAKEVRVLDCNVY